ncbi:MULTISPECIES: hypothetical protein [Paenibacillaceae]|uniref:hypothetical protein n=1 Tax=Paenibacillaceae TaxID=186822 RepID=UPI00036FE470|nr:MULTISPECIES: hypothetical protein [Paenibacillaceae]
MIEDRINIGLSVEANNVADVLEETEYFEDRLAIAKFALAYAVRNGLDTGLAEFKVGESGGTKWNIGSVDADKYLHSLILSLYPDTKTPYRYIEALMNKGLLSIGKIIEAEGIGKISKFM